MNPEDMKDKLMELGPSGVSYKDILNAKMMGLRLDGLASFRVCMAQRERQRKLCGFGAERSITNKLIGYEFAEKIGLKTPLIRKTPTRIADAVFLPGTVVKPVSSMGSCGVFMMLQDGSIVSCRERKIVSRSSMYKSIGEYMDTGKIPSDKFIVEKIIMDYANPSNPARDIKFYMFYGKTGFILEMSRFPPSKDGKYMLCYLDENMNRINIRSVPYDHFDGLGVQPEHISLAKSVSTKIPSPFIRLDFLYGVDGLYFVEFTGGTGNFDEITREYDSLLGDMFVEAEGNLTKDLLLGKKFDPIFHPRPK